MDEIRDQFLLVECSISNVACRKHVSATARIEPLTECVRAQYAVNYAILGATYYTACSVRLDSEINSRSPVCCCCWYSFFLQYAVPASSLHELWCYLNGFFLNSCPICEFSCVRGRFDFRLTEVFRVLRSFAAL